LIFQQRSDFRADLRVAFRILPFEPRGQRCQFRLRLLD
jgi:hypothetical protein